MKLKRKTFVDFYSFTLLAISMVAILTPSYAAEWRPQKAIRLIVTDGPGGPYDGQARVIANEMAKRFDRPVIVDNVAGGGMMMGTIMLYRAKPDGYTIAFTSSMALISNQLFSDAKYDLNKFTYLGQTSNSSRLPGPVVTTAQKGLDSWEEVLKLDRPFRWATPGKGTVSYIASKAMSHAFGFKNPVFVTTYTGAEVLPSVIRGECDGANITLDLAEPFIKTGQLKFVLVAGRKRYENYPNVPSLTDVGHPEIEKVVTNYYIAIAPPDMPKNIYKVIGEAVQQAVESESMKEYHKRAISRGATYESAAGDVTRKNVLDCLETVEKLAPYLK